MWIKQAAPAPPPHTTCPKPIVDRRINLGNGAVVRAADGEPGSIWMCDHCRKVWVIDRDHCWRRAAPWLEFATRRRHPRPKEAS